jgi:8-oxo-dGTP diphosphatase
VKPEILVVAAAVRDHEGRIFCALRSKRMDGGGRWEFPGGKVEAGESLEAALVREFAEEFGCAVTPAGPPLADAVHDDGRRRLRLVTFPCVLAAGEPRPSEHAAVLWLAPDCLESLVWAPADLPAVRALASAADPSVPRR